MIFDLGFFGNKNDFTHEDSENIYLNNVVHKRKNERGVQLNIIIFQHILPKIIQLFKFCEHYINTLIITLT